MKLRTKTLAAWLIGAMLTLSACGGGGGGSDDGDDGAEVDGSARSGGVEMTAEQQAMLPEESGYVRLKVSVSAVDGAPRPSVYEGFKNSFEACNLIRQIHGQAPQPLPLEEMDHFMGYSREHMYDAEIGAGREESYNRFLVPVQPLPKDAAPDCTATYQVREFRETKIWGRDGFFYRIEYDQDGKAEKVVKSVKPSQAPKKVEVLDGFPRVQYAGQTCVKPNASGGIPGWASLCNWEPFSRVNFKNLPIFLENTIESVDRVQLVAEEATTNRSAFGGGWGGKAIDAVPEGVPVVAPE